MSERKGAWRHPMSVQRERARERVQEWKRRFLNCVPYSESGMLALEIANAYLKGTLSTWNDVRFVYGFTSEENARLWVKHRLTGRKSNT